MGMRVKVAIGYGLHLEGLNADHLHNRWEGDESLWDQLTEDIITDIRQNIGDRTTDRIYFRESYQNKAALEANHMAPFHLNDIIHYDAEFFEEDRVLIQPYPFNKNFYRSDDDIDYFVSGILAPLLEPTETIWEETKRSIYPYVGLMRPNPDYPCGVETYMESCYMDRDPEYIQTLTTMVPLHLMFVIKHLFQIKEEDLLDTFFKMKPVFARWWS